MEPVDINYKLKKLKPQLSQVDIARILRVKKQTVNNVIWGKTRSARIQKFIAKKLGMKVEDIWPKAA